MKSAPVLFKIQYNTLATNCPGKRSMPASTYAGTVHNGKIELEESIELPEGSRVYIAIPDPRGVDEETARERAIEWLNVNVGENTAVAGVMLLPLKERPLWHFEAFVVGPVGDLRGPIGYVDIHAGTGEVLSTPKTIETMIKRSEDFTHMG
jgi:hypothetical protein